MTDKIIEALRNLDVTNDNHWTMDGHPRLDTVRMLAADQSLSRDSVVLAAPGFSRSTALTWTPGEDSAAQGPKNEPHSPRTAALGVAGQPAESALAVAPVTPSSPPQQPEMAQLTVLDREDGAQTLEEALEEAKAETIRIRDLLDKLNKDYAEAQNREAQLQHAWNKTLPAQSDSDAIQEYLASQRRALEERAARKALLAESGINFKDLARDLRSPIDAAMARKNMRGNKRPGG